MAKKKKPLPVKHKKFDSDPFNSLKGFAVSEPRPQLDKRVSKPAVEKTAEVYGSFADEMAMLGVERLNSSEEELEVRPEEHVLPQEELSLSEDHEFLQALGTLDVSFFDRFSDEELPPTASARRMKQLRQGKLIPEASLDLHGLSRVDVAEKLHFYLQDAQFQGWSTVLVVTGKGLHSAGGEPVLRNEAERFLAEEGGKLVAEWGRAPKQYGGDGALVLFLRKGS